MSEEVGQPGQARPGHLQTLRLQLLTSSLRPLYLVATFVFVPNGHLEKLWNGPVRICEKNALRWWQNDQVYNKFWKCYGNLFLKESSCLTAWQLRKFVSEEVVMSDCLTAPDAQTTIYVVPESSWRSNYHIRSVCEHFAPEALYL